LRKLLTLVLSVVLGGLITIGGFVPEAEAARRAGGGKSIGMQREAAPQRPAPGPTREAAPSQAQQSPAAAPPMNAAPQRPGMGRWLAPLAGLAAGLGLAALFGDQLGSIFAALLVAAAVIFGVVLVMRLLGGRRRAEPAFQAAGAGAGERVTHEPMRYSGHETVAAPPATPSSPVQVPHDPNAAAAGSLPAGFDVEGFLRQAKRSFIALQGANDRGDLDTLRDLTTDEMFEHLRSEVVARGGSTQQVDVVTLDAELLDVVTENDQYRASLRFSGLLREEDGGAPTSFDEVWHLQKPVSGSAGWLLAGIQQPA
jgi:predicted lipid-binding transport protein (Tim44 family)